jgi:hypothetical protein
MTTCLPDFLWTDPLCIYLRKRRRRLWQLLCDMERLRTRWHADDVARWSLGVWAANLDVGERQFAKDLAELRALGLVDAEAIRLVETRPTPTEVSEPTVKAPRPLYPSDRTRRSKPDSATTPQTLRNDSARTPQTLRTDSADTPQPPSAESASHTGARPANGSVPFPLNRSVVCKQTENSSVCSVQKTERNGNGGERESRGGEDAADAPAESVSVPGMTSARAVLLPPLSLKEELLATGMSAADAGERLKKFPAVRLRDALDEMAYRWQQAEKKGQGDFKPAGFVARFLDGGWEISAPAVKRRESQQQAAMHLPPPLRMHETKPPAPAPRTATENGVDTRQVVSAQAALGGRQVCECPPPQEMLQAARVALRGGLATGTEGG